MTDAYNQQTQFPPVQQLQDSSTLESQALSTSFHQQNLLPVPSSDTINVVSIAEVSSLSRFYLILHCNYLKFAYLRGHVNLLQL